MSFFTCFCDLPQKEHFRRSESPNFAIFSRPLAPQLVRPGGGATRSVPILRASSRRGSKLGLDLARGEDLVDDAVLLCLLRRHDEVAVGILLDLLDGLARV